MRIVFLATSAGLGGAERVLVEMAAALRERVPQWPVAAILPEDGPLAERLRALGAEVRVLPLPAALAALGESSGRWPVPAALAAIPALIGYLRALRRVLAGVRPDVVHSNGLKMHLLGALARPSRARLVWHLHDFLSGRPAMVRLLRAVRGRCAVALAVSRAVAEEARGVLGNRPPVRVVRNRIDLDRFDPGGAVARLDSRAGLPAAEPELLRVGLVATMGLWKGHETFIRALALLPADVRVRGYIVGGPVYRTRGSEVSPEALRQTARTLGLDGRLGFTGFMDEPAEAMRALDVVVHASTQPEPFGLVIAEAMAAGRALIAAAAGGAAELVHPGEDALTFPPGDAAALAHCIALLARDAGLRQRLAAAGRQRALREFGRDGLADQLIEAYGA